MMLLLISLMSQNWFFPKCYLPAYCFSKKQTHKELKAISLVIIKNLGGSNYASDSILALCFYKKYKAWPLP